jgi:hypothetical protein
MMPPMQIEAVMKALATALLSRPLDFGYMQLSIQQRTNRLVWPATFAVTQENTRIRLGTI